MEELNLHHSALTMGTEGNFHSEGTYDVRIPHWPGSASGVTIGFGFDIGASGISAQALISILTDVGVSEADAKLLAKSCGFTREAAKEKLKELGLRSKILLTQQQVLDLLQITKQGYQLSTQKYFSKSYNKLHPAVVEAYVKVCYGRPATAKSIAEKYDAKLAAETNEVKQCELCIESLKDTGRDKYKGIIMFIEKTKEILAAGGKVNISYEPATPEQLLKDNTMDVMAAVQDHTHGRGTKKLEENVGNSLRANVETANKKEPATTGSKITSDLLNDGLQAIRGNKGLYQKAQTRLVALGYFEKVGVSGAYANADGSWGDNSRKAMRAYQKDNRLPESGELDAESKKRLLSGTAIGLTQTNNTTEEEEEHTQPEENQETDTKSWYDRIVDFVKEHLPQAPPPQPQGGNAIFDWIKEKASPIFSLFDKDPQTNSGSFWDLVKQAIQQVAGNAADPTPTQGGETAGDQVKAALKGKGSIGGSVGKGGANNKLDVLIVRALLTCAGYHDKNVWKEFAANKETLSKSDSTLVSAIEKFQKEKVGLNKPDGRVDSGGKTLGKLNGGGSVAPIDETPKEEEVPVTPAAAISASVGKGGANVPADVLLVKKLLNQKISAGLTEDNTNVAGKTIAAIEKFQKEMAGISKPDGLIEVGGKTWKALSGSGGATPSNGGEAEDDGFEAQPASLDASVFPCFN